MKTLLVGEDNPYGSDPRYALFPYPENCAGHRLCHKVLGISRREYLRGFDRANLCARKWSAHEAREKAFELAMHHDKLVLLGAKVARAFEMPHIPFSFQRVPASMYGHARVVVQLPHPSGRCRAWNEPGAYERARRVLTEAGVLPVLLTAADEGIPESREELAKSAGNCSCAVAPCPHDLAVRGEG